MKIILSAGEIPEGSVVTKITGQKEYRLRSTIKIYGGREEPRIIVAAEGTRMLVADSGDVNCIPSSLELIWHAEPAEIIRQLQFLTT